MSKRNKKSQIEQSDKLPETSVFVTVGQIAKVLDYTPRAITRFLVTGKLPGRKIGGEWRMHKEDFRKLTAPLWPDEPYDKKNTAPTAVHEAAL